MTRTNKNAVENTWEPGETVSPRGTGLRARIFEDRERAALNILDEITLAAGSRFLEVSRESGEMTLAAARRGFDVTLLVHLPAIAAKSRERIGNAGYAGKVTVSSGTLANSGFQDGTFDLVTALNIFPWELSPDDCLDEIRRILRPGGYFLTAFQNRWRLSHFFDPRLTPFLTLLFRTLKPPLLKIRSKKFRTGATIPRAHSIREISFILAGKGFTVIREKTAGFGPFTFLGKRVMPDRWGKTVHSRLQSMADTQFPIVWRRGSFYIVLARKQHP